MFHATTTRNEQQISGLYEKLQDNPLTGWGHDLSLGTTSSDSESSGNKSSFKCLGNTNNDAADNTCCARTEGALHHVVAGGLEKNTNTACTGVQQQQQQQQELMESAHYPSWTSASDYDIKISNKKSSSHGRRSRVLLKRLNGTFKSLKKGLTPRPPCSSTSSNSCCSRALVYPEQDHVRIENQDYSVFSANHHQHPHTAEQHNINNDINDNGSSITSSITTSMNKIKKKHHSRHHQSSRKKKRYLMTNTVGSRFRAWIQSLQRKIRSVPSYHEDEGAFPTCPAGSFPMPEDDYSPPPFQGGGPSSFTAAF